MRTAVARDDRPQSSLLNRQASYPPTCTNRLHLLPLILGVAARGRPAPARRRLRPVAGSITLSRVGLYAPENGMLQENRGGSQTAEETP